MCRDPGNLWLYPKGLAASLDLWMHSIEWVWRQIDLNCSMHNCWCYILINCTDFNLLVASRTFDISHPPLTNQPSPQKFAKCNLFIQNSHQEFMDERLLSWQYENEASTKESCKELLVQLKKRHLDPVMERLQRREGAKLSFEDIINAYDKIKDDYRKLAKGAEDVIAAVFFEYHRVRKPWLLCC